MGKIIVINNYKLAFAFLEQRMQPKYDEADQYVKKCRQDFQDNKQKIDHLDGETAKLSERQRQISLLARMFRFGGEEFDEKKMKADLAGRLEENKERAASCGKRINEIEADGERKRNEQFLEDAAFLKQQKELFLSRKLKNLPAWDYQKKEDVLQAEYLLLCLETEAKPNRDMFDSLWGYLSGQEFKEIPMSQMKEAFCAACAYHFLKRALVMHCENADRDAVDRAIEQIGQILADVQVEVEVSPYYWEIKKFRQLQNLGNDKVGIEEIVYLGMRYDFYPDDADCCKTEEQRLEIYRKVWYSCFTKAMEDEAYYKIMKELLKGGFYDFLTAYDRQEKKNLNNVLAEWKDRERFADYAEFFKKEMERYLQKKEEQARREEQAKKAEKERNKEQKKERIAAIFRKAPAGSEGLCDRGALAHMLMLFSAMIAATGNIYLFAGAWLLLLFAGRKAKPGWKTDIQLILVFLISMAAYYFTGGYSLVSALFVTKEAGFAALSGKIMLFLFVIPVIARRL